MPSTLQKTLRLGALLPLLCLTCLASTIAVRADEAAPNNRSGEIYRAFNAKPQKTNTSNQPSPLENAPRFSNSNHQTAPLAALINDPGKEPVKDPTTREPARLFEDESYFEPGRPIASTRPTQDKRGQSPYRPANQIATTGSGRVSPVNHLRNPQETTPSPDDRSSANVPTYTQPYDQTSDGPHSQTLAQASSQFSPQPKAAPTPLPESSTSSSKRLPPKGESNEKGQNSNGIFTMLMTMGGALLLVIGLFLVFAWMMRRTSTRTGGMLPQGVVEVLGHQTIAGRQQVHLLRIGRRLLLVSVMPDSMETLTEITDPVEVDRIAGICRQTDSGSSTGAFQAIMRQFNQDPNQTQEPVPTVDQLRQRIGG